MQFVHVKESEQLDGQSIDEQIELMTANLLKIKREITERKPDQQSQISEQDQKSLQHQQIRQQIRQRYDQFLTEHNLPNNHEQKLAVLLQENISIGSTVALFQMLYYFREAINQDVIYQIAEKVSKVLTNPNNSLALNQCLIELLAICGVYDQIVVNFVIEQMIEEQLDFELCFLYLSNVGFAGIAALIHLARQDFKEISIKILDYLSRTDEIIKELLLPILIEDLNSAKIKQKDIILAILNRMNSYLGSKKQIYPILIDMMQNNSFDRGMVASVLRSSGLEGQKILLQFLTHTRQNDKIIFPIATVLPWRAKSQPSLRIKVIQYTLGSNFLPGTLYQYEGKIEPSAFSTDEDQYYDSLCLNARDFIAALQRLVTLKVNSYQNQQTIRKSSLNHKKLFKLHQIICGEAEQQISISGDVVQALIKILHHKNPQIVQAAINSLGLIGLPQAYESIQEISKCLWHSDPRNRSMSCWALSKLCQEPTKKIITRLLELLKDNFWKVRTSACICIGKIVKKPYENVVQSLVRCLKDNTINKTTVCQAIIELGSVGEQILLQILKTASTNDFKLKQSVIFCLREADVKSPSIDFVLEELFKHCKGTRTQTRAVCLETLNQLRLRAVEEEEQIIYLKAKSILPFYYYFLEDPSSKIRDTAMESIYSFGNQAQLIFIEGITKGNPLVRVQSAKGLGKLGVQNFRALILGLRDQDAQVKKVSADVILQQFSAEDVVSYYSMKTNQAVSLLCNLKDMLLSGGYRKDIKGFIKQVIFKLEKEMQINGAQIKQNSSPNQSGLYLSNLETY